MDELDFDILKEIGNIGANNAAVATSQLFRNRISISVTDATVINVREINERIGPPETIVAAVFVRILHKLSGGLLLLMPRPSALATIDILTGKPIGETQHLQEMETSAFKEFGNILTGAYISAVANFLNVRLDQSIPYAAFDMVGAVVDFLGIEIGKFSENAILVRTELASDRIKGSLVLVLDAKSARQLVIPGRKKISD